MSSEPVRNPIMDPLMTPENAALLIIDYQPTQIKSLKSVDHDQLVANIVTVAKTDWQRRETVPAFVDLPFKRPDPHTK
jgi:nicotinamidase-related amidase